MLTSYVECPDGLVSHFPMPFPSLSKANIECRIGDFIAYLQMDIQHCSFSPGNCWWLAATTKTSIKKVPNAVLFLEQLNIPPAEMDRHYGPRWSWRIESLFPTLHVQKWFNQINFITARRINDSYSNLTPNDGNIGVKSEFSIHNWAWERLREDICHCAATAQQNHATPESQDITVPSTVPSPEEPFNNPQSIATIPPTATSCENNSHALMSSVE